MNEFDRWGEDLQVQRTMRALEKNTSRTDITIALIDERLGFYVIHGAYSPS
jgi:hypothetical protein